MKGLRDLYLPVNASAQCLEHSDVKVSWIFSKRNHWNQALKMIHKAYFVRILEALKYELGA